MATKIRFLCVGDIIGAPGMAMFQKWVPKLKEKHAIDAVIVNGENANKNGMGLTPRIIETLKEYGANVVTTGNHAFDQAEVYNALNERDDVIRPANYPPGCPGRGVAFFSVHGNPVAVVNLHGRVFVREMLDCPFRTIESLLTFVKTKTNTIILDLHAEATSEKRAIGGFVDGKVSCVFGTHTHVQTADEHILPRGTAYITDVGACNALHSVVGFQQDAVIQRLMIHHKMGKFTVENKGPLLLCAIIVDVDAGTGRALAIERVRVVDDTLTVD